VLSRDTVLLAIGGVASAAAYAILAWTSRHEEHVALPVFFSCLGVAAAVCLTLYWHLRRTALSRGALVQLLLWACVFRVIGFVSAPVYEDDFYRYLWDGRTFALTGNPYGVAPATSFGDDSIPENFQNILSRINYPEVPTIYGPVCQLAFLAAYGIAPGKLWALKLIFIAADIGIVWLLWTLVGNSAALLLYAWSPLVLKEIAFTGHTDVLAALFVLVGFVLLRRNNRTLAGVGLALGVAAKVVAFVPVPFLLSRKRWLNWAAFTVVLAGLYLPFAVAGRSELGGLGTFALEWEFNSFGFVLLKTALGAEAARIGWLLLFGLFYSWYFIRRQNEPNLALIFGVFFALAPVVNPWYLLVLAPFVVLKPELWSIVALQTVMLAYVTAGNLSLPGASLYDHSWWVRPAELFPVVAVATWQWWTHNLPFAAKSTLLDVETKGAIS
jgi:hypothetical protein